MKPSIGSIQRNSSKFTSWLYVSTYTTFTHANGLVVVADPMDERCRFGGHLDHCGDELDTLPQEDRVREVSSSF